ncbi:RES domain-containing protein [Paraburkholderia sp. JPY432]|uniref:RES family NAD+ phosphorylase n=1 Tax=Paraburkholderia youngii TaxID=2782701 RepID=UPI001595EFAB|nr:RES family NAD+ phosphorylase [Paraburkholderia youngii]NVH74135.1 RES domain-containing protein [Paraburkholderia youngii]
MAARALRNPARNFGTFALPVVTLKAKRLVRISSYCSGEPHFGKTATHRFDDPKKEYGTSYFGLNLATAVAESLLHDLEPVGTRYRIAADEVKRRFIHTFDGEDLTLADLTGQSMNVLGAHAGLFGTAKYSIPMRWSRAIHAHPADVDGILYVSRMMAPHLAVVLFDRGGSIGLTHRKPSRALASSAAFAQVRKTLHIAYT